MNSTFMRIFVFFSLAILPGICQEKKKPAQSFPKVTIPGSELRTLKSTSTGRRYDLYIHIPPHYAQEVGEKYPVLYLLDGQWDFKLLDSVLGGLVYDKFAPDMIIVGITYSGANPDYNALRAMDDTPTATANVKGSGGGPKFLAFLKTELIPFIESHYRADSNRRVLMGSSYGGLFTLYAMLTDPNLCWAYVAASPAVTYDDDFFLKQEAEYAQTHKDLPVKLFLAVGELEDLSTPVKDLMKTIPSRNYKGLKLETRVIEGERHAGNKPETFNRGLRFVFSGEYPLPPDRAFYDRSMQFYAHKKYEQALIVLQTLINTYADSQYAERAKLTMDNCWLLPECVIAHEQFDSLHNGGGGTFAPTPATGTLETLCDISQTAEIKLNISHDVLVPGYGLDQQVLPVILHVPRQTIEDQGIKNPMDATATACDPDRTCDRDLKARVQFTRLNSKGASGAYVIERSDGHKQTGTFKVRAKPVNICK